METMNVVERGARPILEKDLLITTSLLDQIDFHCGCSIGSEWKAKSLIDLKGQLSRAPWTGSKFTERGIQFERKICNFVNVLSKDKFFEVMARDCLCDVKKLAPFYDKCRGGEFQRVLKKIVTVGGQRVCLYGKSDVIFPERIVDIKTTSSDWVPTGKYSSDKKYTDKSQHTMYAYISEILEFEYLVARFAEEAEGVWKVIDVHQIPANTESVAAAEKKLFGKIEKALDFIHQDAEMWENYTSVFSRG